MQAGAAPRVALVAGASGLTGRALLQLMLRGQQFARVVALSRRPLPVEHARLANRILRFEDLASGLKGLRCSDAFCALGATGGPRASEPELREVDLGLALEFARAARAAGATRLVIVSAAGAARNAGAAFLRIKGEMESAIRELGFSAIDLMQPGVVLGVRHGDGVMDLARQGLLAVASPLLRRRTGVLNAMPAQQLAEAMLGAALAQRVGIRTYSGDSLATAARGFRTRLT